MLTEKGRRLRQNERRLPPNRRGEPWVWIVPARGWLIVDHHLIVNCLRVRKDFFEVENATDGDTGPSQGVDPMVGRHAFKLRL